LYIFFWVFPRRQIVDGRRFRTLYQFHLQRLGEQCGQLQFDAGEIPRRKYTKEEGSFYQQIGLKFEEETNKMQPLNTSSAVGALMLFL